MTNFRIDSTACRKKRWERRAAAWVVAALGVWLTTACASSPKDIEGSRASWTKKPSRTVESGRIIHLGYAQVEGEGVDQEIALKNAEAQALQDIAHECSFVPKGTRTDTREVTPMDGGGYHAWVKASVGIETCDAAKNAVESKVIKQLANAEMTSFVERYQREQVGDSLLLSLSDSETSESGESAIAPPPAPIRDEIHYYVVRQQVVYAKQKIILKQKERNPAATPSQARIKAGIIERSANLRKFEDSHPEFKRTPRSWSGFGREAVLRSPWVNPLVRHPHPPVGKERAAKWLNLNVRESKVKSKNVTKKIKKPRSKKRF